MGHLFRIQFQYLPLEEKAVCSRASTRRRGPSLAVRRGGQICSRWTVEAMREHLRDLAARHFAVPLREARAAIASDRAACLATDRVANTLRLSIEAAPRHVLFVRALRRPSRQSL